MAADNEKMDLKQNELEARRMRLKTLIMLGKERGYLTYAEINDHLPDDMQDAEQIEGITSMINEMGIQVYDEAPDAESLLMTEASPPVADEDVVEEAERALTTVDSEFGRTTETELPASVLGKPGQVKLDGEKLVVVPLTID